MTTFKTPAMVLMLSIGMAIPASAQINNPAPYCESNFDNQYNMFRSIKVNTGAAVELGAMGGFGDNADYRYYNTTTLPNMTIGQNNTIEIVSYSVQDIEPVYFAVYIDVNKNNTFEANEVFMQNSNTINAKLSVWEQNDQTIAKTFVLPAAATAGKTRMRVVRGTEVGNLEGNYNANFTAPACNMPNSPATNTYGMTYDFDVNMVKSGTTGINENIASNNAVKMYPNPANDYLNIDVIKGEKIESVSIIGIDGKIISSFSDVKSNRIETGSLQNGIYFLQVRLAGKVNTIMNKFVKN